QAMSPRLPPKLSILPTMAALPVSRATELGTPPSNEGYLSAQDAQRNIGPENWAAFGKSHAVALGRGKAHDGPVSIVICARFRQLLESLGKLPIDSPAHFAACRVIRADDQQPPDGQRFEHVSHRDQQLLRIKIRGIKNVHHANDIHSTRQGVRLKE